MSESKEIWIKLILCLCALFVVLWRNYFAPVNKKKKGTFTKGLLLLLAIISVLSYYNFGKFHGQGYVHYWESFHYHLNSKYFPELGYDGLYIASIAAQEESNPRMPLQPTLRDLRNNEVVATSSLEAHKKEVKARFTSERWNNFRDDNRHFIESNTISYIAQIRGDHGFNATPSWVFTARLFSAGFPSNRTNLELQSGLDLVLLLIMFGVIFKTYGLNTLTLSLIIFGLGYCGRFFWVGGSYLRQDWLVTAVLSICMLKQKRYAYSGVFMAYSTMMRLFPMVFLFGLGVLALKSFVKKEMPKWLPRFAIGYIACIMLCLCTGSLAGRGPGAWVDFKKNISKHHGTWLNNNVGLQNIILYGQETYSRSMVDFKLPEPWEHWQTLMDERTESRAIYLYSASFAFLILLAAALWNQEEDQATIMCMAAVFSVFILTNYYWLMFLMLPMKKNRPWVIPLFLIINIIACCVHLFGPGTHEIRYGFLSCAFTVFFLAWLLPDAYRTFRGHEPQLSKR